MNQEKKFEKRSLLLKAALKEFIQEDYKSASLNRIIKESKVSKGSFYYHFKDKEELYISLLKDVRDKKWEFINGEMIDASKIEEMDIFQMFKDQMRIGIKFAFINKEYHRLWEMFLKERGNTIYESAEKELLMGDSGGLEEIIKGAYARGDFNEGFPQEFIIATIQHMFSSFNDVFMRGENISLEDVEENLVNYIDFMKRGLGK